MLRTEIPICLILMWFNDNETHIGYELEWNIFTLTISEHVFCLNSFIKKNNSILNW